MSMFNPPPPGRLILEYVIDHGDSVAALAQRLDVELGLSADLWLRMQAEYDAAHC